MTQPRHDSCFAIRQRDSVTVVTFTDPELLEDELIDAIGNALADRVVHHGQSRLILNFSAVTFLNSDTLGMLLSLLRKVNLAGGRLALCAFNPRFREMMATLQLNRVFDIYDSENEALASFGV
jgi:anti-sigma B factor antagonist